MASVAVWPELRVRGKVAPEFVKPAPERVAELTVTGALPVEERVSDWVVAVLIPMLPKAMLVALMVRVGTAAGFSCRTKVLETPP